VPARTAVEDLLEKAAKHLGAKQPREALKLLQQAVSLDPNNAQASYYEGCAHQSLKQHEQAIASFQRCAARAGARAALPLYNMGNSYQALSRNEDAKRCFREALKVDPKLADAWVNLGRLFDDGKDHKEALTCYEMALRLQPNDGICLSNRGNTLRALGQDSEALASYEQAMKLLPAGSVERGNCMLGMSMSLLNVGRAEEALRLVDQLLQAGRTDPVAIQRVIILGTLKRFDEALAEADKVIAGGARAPQLWNNRAELLASLKRYDEAIGDFDKALALEPTFHPSWFGKARALFNAGKPRDSAEALSQYKRVTNGREDTSLAQSVQALEQLLSGRANPKAPSPAQAAALGDASAALRKIAEAMDKVARESSPRPWAAAELRVKLAPGTVVPAVALNVHHQDGSTSKLATSALMPLIRESWKTRGAFAAKWDGFTVKLTSGGEVETAFDYEDAPGGSAGAKPSAVTVGEGAASALATGLLGLSRIRRLVSIGVFVLFVLIIFGQRLACGGRHAVQRPNPAQVHKH
jgi:tetratricopeptide (TPR) repeat protein